MQKAAMVKMVELLLKSLGMNKNLNKLKGD